MRANVTGLPLPRDLDDDSDARRYTQELADCFRDEFGLEISETAGGETVHFGFNSNDEGLRLNENLSEEEFFDCYIRLACARLKSKFDEGGFKKLIDVRAISYYDLFEGRTIWNFEALFEK